MGTTKRSRDFPATVIDMLEQEWESLVASQEVLEAFERWGRDDEFLGQFPTIASLFAWAACRSRPAAQREEVLAALACRAGTDAVAAQMLLQLLLPGCKALVASFSWLGDSPGERAADVVGDVWARIRALPSSPRPTWVALPVLSAAREQLRRRARHVALEAPCAVDEHSSASELMAAEPESSAAEELADLLGEALSEGVLSDDQARLIWSYRVQRTPPAEAARRGGGTAGAVERRRLRAEHRLRNAYGVSAA